ncbi:MAG: enoyl-CoA hydratase/isomerase family protein [Actinobacteria bacterium]|nr:MAG: enoyl-CoA hydratase/isomerase family protein [Actinomycetota bacterium]
MSDASATDDAVLYRVDRGVARITLNRPEAQNALTWGMRDRLAELFEAASASLAVRSVLLTGTGKAFCAGADLRGPRPTVAVLPGNEAPEGAPERAPGDVARMIRRGWQRLVGSILDCEKPVVCAVNGTAAGGGTHLVLASDLVVMADEARLIEVFVRRGLVPDAGGCYLLPRIVGVQRAKELMFFGDDVSAATADRIGLVNAVVPLSELEKTATEWAERLAGGPTKTIAMTKWLLNRSLESDRGTAFYEEGWAQEAVSATEDSREGRASFVERRPPNFRGW